MKKVREKIFKTPSEKAFARHLIRTLIEGYLAMGRLKISDLKDTKSLIRKVRRLIPKSDEDLRTTIIYHGDLIKHAETFIKEEDFAMAAVAYATYFEHWVNEIIQIWFSRNNIPIADYRKSIRRLSIEDKLDWFLVILKLTPFNKEHLKTVLLLSETRNAFLHYKYDDIPGGGESRYDILMSDKKFQLKISRAIKYTKQYRSRLIYGGHKGKNPISRGFYGEKTPKVDFDN